MSSSLPAIPWDFDKSDLGSHWIWDTQHFTVVVNGDSRSFYYQISDKSANPSGPPQFLADGQAASFEQAEKLIRGTIGKAYNPPLGYQHFAGPLATTFTLGTGKQADLGIFIGQNVEVVTLNQDGTEKTYKGIGSVDHYDFILQMATDSVRISPSYILSVKTTGSRNTISAKAPSTTRTFSGKIVPGCTGRLGFLPNTVEHVGSICPIHEEN